MKDNVMEVASMAGRIMLENGAELPHTMGQTAATSSYSQTAFLPPTAIMQRLSISLFTVRSLTRLSKYVVFRDKSNEDNSPYNNVKQSCKQFAA